MSCNIPRPIPNEHAVWPRFLKFVAAHALSSQSNFTSGAIEQSYAKATFQHFDLQRRRGLGEQGLLRSLVKIQVFRYGTKHLQAKVLELLRDLRSSTSNIPSALPC